MPIQRLLLSVIGWRWNSPRIELMSKPSAYGQPTQPTQSYPQWIEAYISIKHPMILGGSSSSEYLKIRKLLDELCAISPNVSWLHVYYVCDKG